MLKKYITNLVMLIVTMVKLFIFLKLFMDKITTIKINMILKMMDIRIIVIIMDIRIIVILNMTKVTMVKTYRTKQTMVKLTIIIEHD
jgi:hypothetical protein